ncbi:hypothetical protein WDZ16_08600 [Pseudokineococcus marinus]|uniref:Integral membrane protein n=1 Tax=Pseudokineococcus marinus TaxID=351215 RepID=A0A849BXE0_9ACTN|nr:hypothetical protein [Pseudokineococcus marinus]NNH24106.1 hypothetical protein [Pseudokineococcus marinus]
MLAPLALLLGALSLALAVWSLVGAVRAARPSGGQLLLAAVLEAAILVQAVIATVLVVTGTRPLSTATFAGYLLTIVLLLPAGVFWGLADRSRWGNGVLAVTAVTTAVLVLRLEQIWNG